MKAKLLWIVIVAILVIGGSVATVAILNSPANVAANALSDLADDLLEREDIKPFYQTFTNGSVQVSVDKIKRNGEAYAEGTHVFGKAYFSEEALLLSDLDISLGEWKLAGDAYISENEFCIREDKILGGAYGMDFATLANDFANSIFAAGSGSEYALDQETYDSMMEMLNDLSQSKEMINDATELLEIVSKDMWEILTDNAQLTSKNRELRINGKKTKVRLITITLDSIAMENMIMDAYDYFCESEDVIAFIEKYEGYLHAMLREKYPYNFDIQSDNSLVEIYKKQMETLGGRLENISERLDSFDTLSVCVATRRMSTTLLKLWIEVGEETILSLDCGEKGIKKTDAIRFETKSIKVSYIIKAEEKLTATLSVYGAEIGWHYLSISVNQEKGQYKLTLENQYKDESNKRIINGTIKTNGDTTAFTINTITQPGIELVHSVQCEVIFDTEDKMPSHKIEYKTVADITEKELDAWIEKMKELIPELPLNDV